MKRYGSKSKKLLTHFKAKYRKGIKGQRKKTTQCWLRSFKEIFFAHHHPTCMLFSVFFFPLLPTGSSSVLPKGTLISGHWVWAAFERRVLSVCAPCWRNNTQTSSKLHHSVHFYSLVKHLLRCIRENGAGGISKSNLYFSGNLKVHLLALSKDSSCIPRPTLKFHYQEQKWCDLEVNFAWLVFGQDSSSWY